MSRERALAILSVTEAQLRTAPQITPQLRMIAKTLRRAGQPKVTRKIIPARGDGPDIAIDTTHATPYGPGTDLVTSWPTYLHSCGEEDAACVLDKFYTVPQRIRRAIPIEAYCVAAGISPHRVLGMLTTMVVQLSQQASSIIAALNHPRVVEKTVEMALTDDGIEDRNTLHRATGFLPTPKSAQTNITVTQQASATAAATAQAAIVPAPAPESTIRRLVDRLNEAKPAALPQASVIELPAAPGQPVPSRVVEAEYTTVRASGGGTDDDSDDSEDDE